MLGAMGAPLNPPISPTDGPMAPTTATATLPVTGWDGVMPS